MQYNEIKSFLSSIAFEDRSGKSKSLCIEITLNILDELRKEHKLRMGIKDKNVDDYIMLS